MMSLIKVDKKQFSPWRSTLLDMLEQSALDPSVLARDLIGWFSEADIKEFCQQNDYPISEDGEDEDELPPVVACTEMVFTEIASNECYAGPDGMVMLRDHAAQNAPWVLYGPHGNVLDRASYRQDIAERHNLTLKHMKVPKWRSR